MVVVPSNIFYIIFTILFYLKRFFVYFSIWFNISNRHSSMYNPKVIVLLSHVLIERNRDSNLCKAKLCNIASLIKISRGPAPSPSITKECHIRWAWDAVGIEGEGGGMQRRLMRRTTNAPAVRTQQMRDTNTKRTTRGMINNAITYIHLIRYTSIKGHMWWTCVMHTFQQVVCVWRAATVARESSIWRHAPYARVVIIN